MATEAFGKPQPKTMILRRLVILMLTGLEIYEDTVLTEVEIKAYDWPTNYINMTYHEALLDCTRTMLLAVLNFHCPNTKNSSQG